MSNAKSFLQKVEANPELQDRLNAVDWDTKSAVTIAREAGFTVSAGELQAAIDERWGNLSEEELSRVSGGDDGHGKNDPLSANIIRKV